MYLFATSAYLKYPTASTLLQVSAALQLNKTPLSVGVPPFASVAM